MAPVGTNGSQMYLFPAVNASKRGLKGQFYAPAYNDKNTSFYWLPQYTAPKLRVIAIARFVLVDAN